MPSISGPRRHDAYRFDVGEPADALDRLPPGAAARLAALRERRDQASAYGAVLFRQLDDGRLELQRAEQRLQQVAGQRRIGMADPAWADGEGDAPADDAAATSAVAEVRRLRRQLADLERRRAACSERSRTYAALVQRVERWIASVTSGQIRDHVGGPVAARGVPPAEAVEQCRLQRRELLARLREIETAPIDVASAKERMRAEVDALSEQGRPKLFSLLESSAQIDWPVTRHNAELHGAVGATLQPLRGSAAVRIMDGAAMLAWLFRDQLLAALDAEIERIDTGNGMSDADRLGARYSLLQQILELERLEVAYLDAAGGDLLPRPDTDPRAALCCTGPHPID